MIGLGLYNGLRLVNEPSLTETAEDWSDVRSHGRARRRRRQGHRQRIRYYLVPSKTLITAGDMLIGHPETLAKLVAAIRKNAP